MEGMELDLDLDQELMQKFSCMGTTDKDILISEFQRLLGFQLNPAGCAFFLDMTNWNLQAAIGAYYDFESPNISAPCMSFVSDVTIGEGESVPPDTPFTKTWRVQNTGAESWPPGVSLKYVGGDQFGHVNMVMVRSLEPQEMADVSVQMHSPASPGMYQGQWRMCTATGLYYGDVIWVILSVEVGGLLGVTQQLSSFQAEFNTQPHRSLEGDYNPFASPEKSKCPNSNNSLHDASGHRVAEEHWQGSPNQLQQEQNGLSQNSVDIVANSLQSNLSVVAYNQVRTVLEARRHLVDRWRMTGLESSLEMHRRGESDDGRQGQGGGLIKTTEAAVGAHSLFSEWNCTLKPFVFVSFSQISYISCSSTVCLKKNHLFSSLQGIQEPYPFGNS